jgi:2-C-methyl-D-erythritol 4-phosphate cytidylyltransferase/2-C-methyl-D-erythritol 2,4-cyclodiphosphate synthase
VVGGAERQDSVRNGLEALSDHQPECVLVHDAARPWVTRNLIDVVLAALEDHMGVIPGVAVVDTLKRTDSEGVIVDTVPREGLWRAQTPQGFSYPILYAAHQSAAGQALTDDAAVMEAAGHEVAMVPGDEGNIKVTTPADLERMEQIMADDGGSDSGAANESKYTPLIRL